jgi:hypothetical protein
MFLITPVQNDRFLAQLILPDGQIAGEGHGRSKKTAMYLACLDTIYNGYPAAALRHSHYLSIKDENAVRAAVNDYAVPASNPIGALYYRPKRVHAEERRQMEKLLRQCGYNPAAAEILQREGMTLYELKYRLRFAPGDVGSLQYTHGLRTRMHQNGEPIMKQNPLHISSNEKIGIGVALVGGVAAAIYYWTRPAAPAGTTVTTSAGTVTVTPTTTTSG